MSHPAPSLSDGTAVRTGVRDDDFSLFMVEALPTLTRTAWNLTRDEHQASELVQQTLVRTYVAWPRARHPLAFARRVMTNQWISTWHSKRREVLADPRDLPEGAQRDSSTDVAERDALVRALSRLGPRQRRAVLLRHVEGLSEKETAQVLGVSVGTVKSATSRGLERLRTLMSEGSLPAASLPEPLLGTTSPTSTQEAPMETPSPHIAVDAAQVLRQGRRRRTVRAAVVSTVAVALVVGSGIALWALQGAPVEPAHTPSPTAGALGPTEIYANDRLYGADGSLQAAGTLLATFDLSDLDAEVVAGCQAAEATVAGSGYFCDWVTKILLVDPAFGATEAERRQRLAAGGLTITTTLDPNIQTAASDEVRRTVPVDDPSGAVQVMAVVEPGTGQVKALAQSTSYAPGEITAVPDYPPAPLKDGATPINLNVAQPYYDNLGFQPGSAFQVFTLLAWLEAGHSLGDIVNGSPQSFTMSQFTSCDGQLSGSSFNMGNSPPSAGGTMTVSDATRNSVNAAFMNMATQLDLCTIMGRAADLGVVQGNPKHLSGEKKGQPLRGENGEYIPVPFNDHYPVNVIGVDSTAPLAMAGAFAAFGSGGVYCTPIAVTQVLDADGNQLPIPDAGCHQEIDPAVASTMNLALSGVWTGTMSSVAAPGFPAAGATGTSNNNEYTWFVGYTPRLSAAVAVVGNPFGFETANQKTIGGQRYGVVYGATIAGPTWVRFAHSVLDDGTSNPAFSG
ncbi:MAG: SigE family RNA polymerase sigma factor [Micrococcales bacterium]|nr:SigE family RNA polymerase sigma factor [Micrococcales bacterium]